MPAFHIEHKEVRCNITKQEAIQDFQRLKSAKHLAQTLEEAGGLRPQWTCLASGAPCPTPLGTFKQGNRAGLTFTMFLHWKLRLRAASVHRRSAATVLQEWKDGSVSIPRAMARMQCSAYEALRLNSALQSVVHFRPSVAAALSLMFEAKSCLDFSAGWGDRLTGFMAVPCVKKIDLIEPRKAARSAYERQHRLAGSEARLRVFTGAAEDVLPTLTSRYDLILTSPPYFNLEIYDTEYGENRRMQVSERYVDCEGYLVHFLVPVALMSMSRLSSRGVLCVNISDNARRGVVICKPLLEECKRHMPSSMCVLGTFCYSMGVNPANRTARSTEDGKSCRNGEPIYVFCHKAHASTARRHIKTFLTRLEDSDTSSDND